MINKDTNILIVGLGLMGGSYAKALKNQGYNVSAITDLQSSIDYAIANKIIDYGTVEIEKDLIYNADLIVFALYPHIFTEWIEKYQRFFRPGTVITDVTGVKGCIVYKIQQMLRKDVEFIAAHPMAGREVYGVENSDETIFHGANYIVVPTDKNTKQAIELCKKLGETLGFNDVSTLTPEQHDEMIAFLSQLTHCIAVSLMCCNEDKNLERYTGDSFRDLTRIARINDVMWTELFLLNKKELLIQMNSFLKTFTDLRNALEIEDKEAMKKMMQKSTQRRKLFDKKL